MKSILLVLLLGFAFCLIECKSENNFNSDPIEKWVQGIWISEKKDTLNFKSDGFLLYNGRPFLFKFMEDSLSLFPIQSSNLNDIEYYRYKLSREQKELILYEFFTADSVKFLKERK